MSIGQSLGASIRDVFMLIHTLQNNLHFLIIMKKLCLWLFNLSRYAKQSEARKLYDKKCWKIDGMKWNL